MKFVRIWRHWELITEPHSNIENVDSKNHTVVLVSCQKPYWLIMWPTLSTRASDKKRFTFWAVAFDFIMYTMRRAHACEDLSCEAYKHNKHMCPVTTLLTGQSSVYRCVQVYRCNNLLLNGKPSGEWGEPSLSDKSVSKYNTGGSNHTLETELDRKASVFKLRMPLYQGVIATHVFATRAYRTRDKKK